MYSLIVVIYNCNIFGFRMAKHNTLGKDGERAAATFLINNGYEIIACNWRYNKIEIDIIANNNESIIFVEVKTRNSSHWGNPEDAVDKTKMRRMVEAADYYVKEYDIDLPVRFDIISIIWSENFIDVKHIDDAFLASLD